MSDLQEHVQPISDLLTAGHVLSKAVLAFQFVEVQDLDADMRKQAMIELFRANDNYLQAYMKAFPKPGANNGNEQA